MKPRWLAPCVGVLCVGWAASATAAPAYVVTTVNLRAGAGTTHEIIAKIPAGSRVEAANCKDGWCEVTWQGKNGFAIQTALDLSGRPPRPRTVYRPPPGYYVEGPPIYYGPPPYYYYEPPYYGPPYYYGPYWRRRWWWW
jgi:uncharacterized protein YraI